jgi:hypothetical protein
MTMMFNLCHKLRAGGRLDHSTVGKLKMCFLVINKSVKKSINIVLWQD